MADPAPASSGPGPPLPSSTASTATAAPVGVIRTKQRKKGAGGASQANGAAATTPRVPVTAAIAVTAAPPSQPPAPAKAQAQQPPPPPQSGQQHVARAALTAALGNLPKQSRPASAAAATSAKANSSANNGGNGGSKGGNGKAPVPSSASASANGNGGGKAQEAAKAKAASKPAPSTQPCKFFLLPVGCNRGASCGFIHDQTAKKLLQQKAQAAKATAASPVQTAAASPSASPPRLREANGAKQAAASSPGMDPAQRKEQAARLFSLLHGGGGSVGTSKPASSSAKNLFAAKPPPSKPAVASASSDDVVGQFDWSTLIAGSREEKLKTRAAELERRRALHPDDDEEAQQLDESTASPAVMASPALPAAQEQFLAQTGQQLDALLLGSVTSSPSVAAALPVATDLSVVPGATSSNGAADAATSGSRSAQFRAVYERCRADEQQLSTLLKQQQLKGLPPLTAQTIRERIVAVRSSARAGYVELLARFSPRLSVAKGVVGKLWQNMYRELEPTLQTCKEKHARQQQQQQQSQISVQRRPQQLDLFSTPQSEGDVAFLAHLQALLDAHFRTLDSLAETIHGNYPVLAKPANGASATNVAENADEDGNDTDETEHDEDERKGSPHSEQSMAAARQLLSALCVCLGDLERYRQLYLVSSPDYSALLSAHGGTAETASWTRCKNFYARSLLLDPLAPSASKSHNQLAVVASYSPATRTTGDPFAGKQHLECLYHYVRALHTHTQPFLPARANILALYEENRIRYTANMSAAGAELSLLLCGLVRLVALLDSRVGLETFPAVFQYVLTQLLKGVLNSDWFAAAGTAASPAPRVHERLVSERTMLRVMTLVLGVVDELIAKDAAIAAAKAIPVGSHTLLGSINAPAAAMHSPVPLGELATQAVSVLHELLGVLVRIPVLICSAPGVSTSSFYSEREVPFLPAISLALLWMHSNFPWVLATQPGEDALSVSAVPSSAPPSPKEQLRVGVAQLANTLSQVRAADVSPPSATDASLLELHGFKPLMSCARWPADPSAAQVDAFAFQSSAVLACAMDTLHVHPRSGRFSSTAPVISTLSVAEAGELAAQQALWAKERAAAERAKDPSAAKTKKKRPSKQAKQRPWMTDQAAADAQQAGEQEDGGEDDDDMQDEADENANAPSAADMQQQPRLSAMESLLSDEALGLTAAADSPPLRAHQPATSSSSSLSLGSSASASSTRPLLILDGPNIAMRHGGGKLFSVRGLELALDELEGRLGLRCLIFLPEFLLDLELVGSKRRAAKAGFEVKASAVPDNVALLRAWHSEGKVVATPAQDYDDSYTVEYARKHPNALVVSNDLYRDFVEVHAQSSAEAHEMKAWLRDHLISFTFVGGGEGKFLLNPIWRPDPIVGLRKVPTKFDTQRAAQQQQQQAQKILQQQQQQLQQTPTLMQRIQPTALPEVPRQIVQETPPQPTLYVQPPQLLHSAFPSLQAAASIPTRDVALTSTKPSLAQMIAGPPVPVFAPPPPPVRVEQAAVTGVRVAAAEADDDDEDANPLLKWQAKMAARAAAAAAAAPR